MVSRFSSLLALIVLAVLAAGCSPPSLLITPVSSSRALAESVVLRESVWAARKIALIDVEGVISNAREQSLLGPLGENPVSLFQEKLDKARGDDAVKAVVLRINSPGGGVTASDLMHEELRRFRERSGKPVVACLMDVAASGGYYLACGADRIIAHATTVTGSIGVIMMLPDFSGVMRRVGVDVVAIKSGPLKDAGSPFRAMKDSERAVFQRIVDAMYERFLDVVSRSRQGLPRDRVRELADGRVYLATEALEAGLIDEIGTLRTALDAAKGLAGISNQNIIVVQYARPLGYRPNIYARSSDAPAATVNLVNVELPYWLRGGHPQFLYLWTPEN